MTARGRLTVVSTALLVGFGVVMIAVVALVMRFVPDYRFGTTISSGATTLEPVPNAVVSALPTTTASPVTITSASDVITTLLITCAVALVVLGAAGALVAWIVAGRVLRPLRQINRAAQLAAEGSLTHRIGLRGKPDEIVDLSTTFDGMLERLDAAFESRRRFAANASHELQTPLAATQTMLDVAIAHPEDADWPLVAERARAANSRSIAIVQSLLDLAELDGTPLETEPVQLEEAASAAIGEVADEASAAGLTLNSALNPATVAGDPMLLHLALVNLLDNAVRHNEPGGTITIRCESDPGDGAWIEVSNTGSIIEPDQVSRLTEPFVRGAGRVASAGRGRAETRPGGRGHGLGLAITAGIAKALGGTLELHPNAGPDGGLTATLRLELWESR